MSGHQETVNGPCREIQELILGWPHLAPGERRRVREHLGHCSRCRAFFEEEQALREMFQRWHRSLRVVRFRWSRMVLTLVATLLVVLGSIGVLHRTAWAPVRWAVVTTWVPTVGPVVVHPAHAPVGDLPRSWVPRVIRVPVGPDQWIFPAARKPRFQGGAL